MMKRLKNRSRGLGMLGLAALIAVLASLCAAVSIASMRSSAGSIRGIQRLQVQAAAEGAAVLLATGDLASSGTITLGECQVNASPAAADDAASTATQSTVLTVHLQSNNRVAYSRDYLVTRQLGSAAPQMEALP